jgi:CBS domain containing-hemolysin-like protein
MNIEFMKMSDLNETALMELFDPREEIVFATLNNLPEEELAQLFAESKKN